MSPTTKIKVLGETWHVPRGFGAAYRRVLKDHLKLIADGEPGQLIGEVIDLLALVGYHATIDQVTSWDLRRRVEATVFAATAHARAGDNPIQPHPRPDWLPEAPWKGPSWGEGILSGPGGTPIPMEEPAPSNDMWLVVCSQCDRAKAPRGCTPVNDAEAKNYCMRDCPGYDQWPFPSAAPPSVAGSSTVTKEPA